MKFENLTIKNFRNFEKIVLNIANKNICFGLNDIGKTNFLYALRFLFDKDIRRNGFLESDFHKKETDKAIEIILQIDISDNDSTDTKKLRAKMKGAILTGYNKVYIKLSAHYNVQDQVAYPELAWGVDLEHLTLMSQRGYRYEIDDVFNVIYIDSYVNLQNLFKKNVSKLIKSGATEDESVLEKISETVDELNRLISSLSGVKSFEAKVTPELNKFRDEHTAISLESEVAINGLYSSLTPFIRQENNDKLYPTSGEGRKKLLTYSIYNLLADEYDATFINLYLIEEPENHLHKSLQISLSKILFSEKRYEYLFLTTHSPFILYDMNDVNLIRVYKTNGIDSASYFYNVPEDFEKYRKMLNRHLAEAVFANKVLLVEGPSELMLFEKVLSEVAPFYEANGGYILSVNGVGFKRYCELLSSLHINCIIKTDNDINQDNQNNGYYTAGFKRCNRLIGKDVIPVMQFDKSNKANYTKAYNDNKTILDTIREKYKIFLSIRDLENDLYDVLGEKLKNYLNVTKNPVKYLQAYKSFHMAELVKVLEPEDCEKIYNHYNFACLKELIK